MKAKLLLLLAWVVSLFKMNNLNIKPFCQEDLEAHKYMGGFCVYCNEPKPHDKTSIVNSIMSKHDPYFDYAHFALGNMKDYTLMSSTINDIAQVYDINEVEAAEIVQELTHWYERL